MKGMTGNQSSWVYDVPMTHFLGSHGNSGQKLIIKPGVYTGVLLTVALQMLEWNQERDSRVHGKWNYPSGRCLVLSAEMEDVPVAALVQGKNST